MKSIATLILNLFILINLQCQNNGTFITKIFDSDNKQLINRLDSIQFINQTTNEKIKYDNVKATSESKFNFKSFKQGTYKISIYNFGYKKYECITKITNIPLSNFSLTMIKKKLELRYLGGKKKIEDKYFARDVGSKYELITPFESPASPFKNDDSLFFFVNRHIDNKLLIKNNIDELNVVFKIDSVGNANLVEVTNRMGSLNLIIKNEFIKVISLFPKWKVSKGLNFKEVNCSFVYDIKYL